MISFRDTQIFYLQTVKKIASIFLFTEKKIIIQNTVFFIKNRYLKPNILWDRTKKRFGCICNRRLLG